MPEDWPGAGTAVGPYQLLTALPDTGPALMYRALDRKTSHAVVVTVLPPLNTTAEREFDGRAAQLVGLRHPAIVPVTSYGAEGRNFYLVSEPGDAESLATMLSTGRRTPASPLLLLRDVADAVDFAHQAGVVHGDLQPDAVTVDYDGHAKVRGFGIAPLLEAGGRSLPASTFRAPEQARTGQSSPAADRYSFAALASRLVQQMPPVAGRGDDVDRVLVRGLAPEPSERWPSCAAMVDALVALQAAPASAPARRSRAGIWIALVLVVILAVLAVLLALNHPPSQPTTTTPSAAMALSRSTVLAGNTVVVSGSNLPAHQAGTVEMESQTVQLATFTADAAGRFSVTVTIPKTTGEGDHVMRVCWNGSCPLTQTMTVTPAPSPTPSPSPSPTPSARPTSTPSASPSASGSAAGATATP